MNIFASSKQFIKNKLEETDNISFKFIQKIGENTEQGKCIISYPKKILCKYDGIYKKILVSKITDFAKNMRKNILDMALVAGANSSHLGGALSIVEILSTLFGSKIKTDNKNNLGFSDRFILSKGHACLAYYAALSEVGYISKEELSTFEKNDSNLLGHPVINRDIGIEFSNGSLGMGLSLGIGVALASKLKKKQFKVFVIIGDGDNFINNAVALAKDKGRGRIILLIFKVFKINW